MSRPVHFEKLADGRWLAACARCPRKLGSRIGHVRGAIETRFYAPSFSEANAWWKEHREHPTHKTYATPRVPTEEDVRLAAIFGEQPEADRMASSEETREAAATVIARRQELLSRLAES